MIALRNMLISKKKAKTLFIPYFPYITTVSQRVKTFQNVLLSFNQNAYLNFEIMQLFCKFDAEKLSVYNNTSNL